MTVADAIGVVRALAVVPVAWAIAADQRPLALAIFAAAALTDALDGWVARRSRTASAHGILLDPLADKVLTVGVLVALSLVGTGWPVTAVTALVGTREIVVAVMRVAVFRRGVALPADALAKGKTAAELAGIAMLVWGLRPWAVLGAGVLGLAFLLGLYTLPRYVRALRSAT